MSNEPAEESKPPRKPWWQSPWFQGACVAFVVFTGMLFYQFVPGFTDDGLRAQSIGLPGADGYYHIKMGWLYRTGEVFEAGENFHWTRESIWNGAFSDKDFLFHLYLVPFTLFADGPGDAEGLIFGAKLGISLLTALMVLTGFAVYRIFGVRHAWLFALGMVVVGGTYWVFRVNLCRSYVASILFALVGWMLMFKRHKSGLFLLAVMYTLAYTASHILIAMLLVRMVMELFIGPREDSTRRKDFVGNLKLMGCVVGGIALGCVLHPNPVELVKLWWVQNVVVLALAHQDSVAVVVDNVTAIFGEGTNYGRDVEIALGRELNPSKGPAVVLGTPVLFFAPMFLPLFAAILGWRPTREAILTATIAVVWLVAYMLNGRFLEYAAPFMTLAIGIWLTHLLQTDAYKAWMDRRPVAARALPISGACVALIASVSIWVGASLSYRVQDRGDIELAGRWLHENEQAHGKVVWHDRWDDFTELIFYASECDYLAGLDPTFFLVNDREKYEAWWEIKRGKRRNFVNTVRDDFNADYILAHRSSSEYFYNRLNEEAHAGRLRLCIRDTNDRWALYEIVATDEEGN